MAVYKNKYIKISMYIIFVLFFMSAFVVPIPMLNHFALKFSLLGSILLLSCISIFKTKLMYRWIKELTTFRAIQYYILFLCWLFINSIIHVCLRHGSFFKSILSILSNNIELVLPLLFGFILIKFIKLNNLIKFIYMTFFIFFLIGFLNYIAITTENTFLQAIFNIILNRRMVLSEGTNIGLYVEKVQSVFEEPGYFGRFIAFMFPLIYQLSFSKYKIFKNLYVNKFIKCLMPFFAWVALFLTRSPIALVFSIIITIVYFIVRSIKRINWIQAIVGLIFMILILKFLMYIFMNLSLDGKYLVRIQQTIENFKNIDSLIVVEASLGTRIVSYINLFILFLQHPFVGCGHGNLLSQFWHQLTNNSPVPLTADLYWTSLKTVHHSMNPNIPLQILAQSGIFSFILLYSFLIKIYLYSLKILKYISPSLLYDFMFGISFFLIINIILSIYDSAYTTNYPYLFMGITLGIVYKVIHSQKFRRISNDK